MHSSFSLLENASTTHLKSKRFCFSPHSRNEVWKWHTQYITFQVLVASNMDLGGVRWRAEMHICTSLAMYQVTNISHVATASGTLLSIIFSPESDQREAPTEALTTVV